MTGGERPPFDVLVRPSAGQQGGVPDGRARPDPHAGCRSTSSASRPGCPRARRKLAIETGAALLPAHCWFDGDGWGVPDGSAAGHQPRATCTRSPRRWPTGSPINIAAHPADWHMLQPQWLADLSDDRAGMAEGRLMRIGMVCPYSFDVPGGVQAHVLQLAEVMLRPRARGQRAGAGFVATTSLPDYVVSAGKAVPIPYNGSVARLRFGPATHRKVKKWLAEGDFDVLHLHEPNAPSLSMLALKIAEGPIVATFHTSTTSRWPCRCSGACCGPVSRRSSAGSRCPTWPGAGRWRRSAVRRGGDPQRRRRRRRSRRRRRWTDTRGPARRCCSSGASTNRARAWRCCWRRCPSWSSASPMCEMLIVGRGDEDELRSEAGGFAGHLRFLGQVDDAERRRRCAAPTCTARPTPAGRASASSWWRRWPPAPPVVASDLDAFRRVLRGRRRRAAGAGRDADALAAALIEVLDDDVAAPALRRRRPPRRSAATTGRWWPARSCGSTRRSPAAGVKVQVAS